MFYTKGAWAKDCVTERGSYNGLTGKTLAPFQAWLVWYSVYKIMNFT